MSLTPQPLEDRHSLPSDALPSDALPSDVAPRPQPVTHTTCLISGGGPAGIVLGLLLARAGVRVTVLEKHADFLRDFRGDSVHATTLDLLDALGLGEQFAELPARRLENVHLPVGGGLEVLASLKRLPGKHKYIAMVPQWDLLDLLATAGAKEPTFTLRMNTETTGPIVEEGRVVGVNYRTKDGDYGQIRADLVVVCEGRRSGLRAAIDMPLLQWRPPIDVWWFRLPRHDGDPTGAVPIIHSSGVAMMMLDRGSSWQCAKFISKGDDATLRNQSRSEFMEGLAVAVPWLADRIDAVKDWDDVKLLEIRVDRLRRWYTEGLLCIGDAAHAMSPMGGVGVNLAIQDAVATARILAPALLRGKVTNRDLAKVQRRRTLPTVITQRVQRSLHANVIEPALAGQINVAGAERLPLGMRIALRIPVVRSIPVFFVARGVLPERAPKFARRQSDSRQRL